MVWGYRESDAEVLAIARIIKTWVRVTQGEEWPELGGTSIGLFGQGYSGAKSWLDFSSLLSQWFVLSRKFL